MAKLSDFEKITLLDLIHSGDYDSLSGNHWEVLQEYFSDVSKHGIDDSMPYGVQKARTGDPIDWIIDKLDSMTEEEMYKLINKL